MTFLRSTNCWRQLDVAWVYGLMGLSKVFLPTHGLDSVPPHTPPCPGQTILAGCLVVCRWWLSIYRKQALGGWSACRILTDPLVKWPAEGCFLSYGQLCSNRDRVSPDSFRALGIGRVKSVQMKVGAKRLWRGDHASG